MLEAATLDSEDLAAVLEAVHRFGRHLDPLANDALGFLPEWILPELSDLGVTALVFPEAHGGLGLGLSESIRVIASLAAHDRSVATMLGLHLGLGSRGIIAFGSPTLQGEILADMAAGRRLGAFAATEPGAGSDLTVLRTRAVLHDDHIVLEGSKAFVTNGGVAGVFSVVAALQSADGAPLGKGIVAVFAEDPGVEVGPEEHKLGLRASSTTPVHFDGVVMPRWRLLGAPGDGERQLSHILAWGRTLMAAGCVGSADRALELAQAHCAARHQFGGPLAAQPVVQEQLLDLEATCLAMRCLVERVGTGPEGQLIRRSTAAKVFCSEGAYEACDLNLQLHGGMGYIEESEVPLLLRDARITRIFEGANDVLLGHLGALSLRPQAVEAAPLAELVSELIRSRASSLGVRILRQPRELHRIGRLAVLLEASAAVAECAPDHPLGGHWHILARDRVAACTVPRPLPPTGGPR